MEEHGEKERKEGEEKDGRRKPNDEKIVAAGGSYVVAGCV